MTIAVVSDKSGIDGTGDAVSSANMMLLANSLDTIINNERNGTQARDRSLFSAATTLTIAEGVVTAPTQALHYIASETGTSDYLDTIGVSNNRFIIIKAASGHTIVIRSGQGNITTLDSNDITLSGNLMLMAWCAGSQWSILSSGGVKNNNTAVVDPTPSNDTTGGYNYGSIWLDTLNDRGFVLLAPNAGTARWKRITHDVNNWTVRAAAATLQPQGIATPTIANTPANVNAADGTFVTLPTTNSSGNLGGFVTTTFNLVRLSFDPIIEWLVKTDATIANIRIWIGLASADVTSSDTATGSFCGFRYSTVAGDGGGTPSWVAVNRDGTTQSPTPAIVAPIVINTLYKLRLRILSSTPMAYFSVNDGAEQAFATNLPAIATDLGMVCRPITQTTAIRILNFSYAKVSW